MLDFFDGTENGLAGSSHIYLRQFYVISPDKDRDIRCPRCFHRLPHRVKTLKIGMPVASAMIRINGSVVFNQRAYSLARAALQRRAMSALDQKQSVKP